ncbi:hypothetical protein SRABI26_01405 [Arthrobacter sp. Bi26]|nr:hypothetical protein SRABI26_01405 [Arthrobacter sp. Bi26]
MQRRAWLVQGHCQMGMPTFQRTVGMPILVSPAADCNGA